jgi:hypothetical protein
VHGWLPSGWLFSVEPQTPEKILLLKEKQNPALSLGRQRKFFSEKQNPVLSLRHEEIFS